MILVFLSSSATETPRQAADKSKTTMALMARYSNTDRIRRVGKKLLLFSGKMPTTVLTFKYFMPICFFFFFIVSYSPTQLREKDAINFYSFIYFTYLFYLNYIRTKEHRFRVIILFLFGKKKKKCFEIEESFPTYEKKNSQIINSSCVMLTARFNQVNIYIFFLLQNDKRFFFCLFVSMSPRHRTPCLSVHDNRYLINSSNSVFRHILFRSKKKKEKTLCARLESLARKDKEQLCNHAIIAIFRKFPENEELLQGCHR